MNNLSSTKSWTQLAAKWGKRFRVMISSLLPDKALKYFPPEFVLRDPILSLYSKYHKKQEQCALILFHLNNYKMLTSTYPHALIEQLQETIKEELVRVIKQVLNEDEVIAVKQFHEDDFCIILHTYPQLTFDQLNYVTLLIRNKLEASMSEVLATSMDEQFNFKTGSVSMSNFEQTNHPKTLLWRAYQSAHAVAMNKLPNHFGSTVSDLQGILENEGITVLTQPIMSLETGDIYGWEMLSRGPQNTLLHMPTDLFNYAYQADLLTEMELVVLKKAFKKIANRQIKESVFINVTSVSLLQSRYLNRVLETLEQYSDIRPEQIIFEITERHSIQDYKQMVGIMQKYRNYGFRFAVDDAGSGYSSLQTISELFPDIIKIDKSVIQNIDQVSVKQTMLQALLFFAKNVNCQVVAEGVETEAEADILYRHDVQMGQGYYFAKPDSYIFESTHLKGMKEKIILGRKTAMV